MIQMRALITGGPGSGCSSTASRIAEILGVWHFDSDAYFHKPTDPPYQEPRSAEERRELAERDLEPCPSWILSGSVATWGMKDLRLSHGIVLDVGGAVRLKRLAVRERVRFGERIEAGGDMREEHEGFMEWAKAYEARTGPGRNLETDVKYVNSRCRTGWVVREDMSLDETCELVRRFLANT